MGDIVIKKFMVDDMKLNNNELIVYALIYGCENHSIQGSLSFIGNMIGITKCGVRKVLISLIEKGLIEKKSVDVNGIQRLEYAVVKGN